MGLEKRKESDMGAEKETNSQQTLRAHPVLVLSVAQRAERRRPREPTVGLGTEWRAEAQFFGQSRCSSCKGQETVLINKAGSGPPAGSTALGWKQLPEEATGSNCEYLQCSSN